MPGDELVPRLVERLVGRVGRAQRPVVAAHVAEGVEPAEALVVRRVERPRHHVVEVREVAAGPVVEARRGLGDVHVDEHRGHRDAELAVVVALPPGHVRDHLGVVRLAARVGREEQARRPGERAQRLAVRRGDGVRRVRGVLLLEIEEDRVARGGVHLRGERVHRDAVVVARVVDPGVDAAEVDGVMVLRVALDPVDDVGGALVRGREQRVDVLAQVAGVVGRAAEAHLVGSDEDGDGERVGGGGGVLPVAGGGDDAGGAAGREAGGQEQEREAGEEGHARHARRYAGTVPAAGGRDRRGFALPGRGWIGGNGSTAHHARAWARAAIQPEASLDGPARRW